MSTTGRASSRTFVVRVDGEGLVLLEDVRSGERARLEGVAGVSAELARRLAAPVSASSSKPSTTEPQRRDAR